MTRDEIIEMAREALSEILNGHCPSKCLMTDSGLLDYHRDLARAALKGSR